MRSVSVLLIALLGAACFEPSMVNVAATGGTGDGGGAGGGGGTNGAGAGSAGGDVGLGGSAEDGGTADAQGDPPICGSGVAHPCVSIEHVYAGGTFSCASLSDDSVRCFGYNDSGQLGDPTIAPGPFALGAVVRGLSATAELELGYSHACASSAGRLTCWGRNTVGQLGTGDHTFSNQPRPNLVLETATTVSTYHSATCAILAGHVQCWGHALNGQSWQGADEGQTSLNPIPVDGLDDIVKLEVGLLHACALRADDTLWCWGLGDSGQLGVGTDVSSPTPVEVAAPLLHPVHRIAVGSHVCVLAGSPAQVQCWGRLPDPDNYVTRPTSLSPQPTSVVRDLQAGHRFACVLLDSGRVECWGANSYGQLGTGGSQTTIPSPVLGLTDAVEIAVSQHHVCALRETGDMVCWGTNDLGQLGTSDGQSQPMPRRVFWD